jgi:hypothetical protein
MRGRFTAAFSSNAMKDPMYAQLGIPTLAGARLPIRVIWGKRLVENRMVLGAPWQL